MCLAKVDTFEETEAIIAGLPKLVTAVKYAEESENGWCAPTHRGHIYSPGENITGLNLCDCEKCVKGYRYIAGFHFFVFPLPHLRKDYTELSCVVDKSSIVATGYQPVLHRDSIFYDYKRFLNARSIVALHAWFPSYPNTKITPEEVSEVLDKSAIFSGA